MPVAPNQPDPDHAGVRKATDRLNNVEALMLAVDIRTEGHEQIVLGCASCSAYQQERVTVPNSVIMDALAAPAEDDDGVLDGDELAAAVFRDERITAKTSANPTPHAPSSHWQPKHVMQRAVDMTNAGLIPFSPFGSFVNQDRMRDRPIFDEWLQRYRAELPSTSTLGLADIDHQHDAADETDQAAWQDEPVEPYPADGTARDVTRWIGDDIARAAEAHQRELERSRPRSTVIGHAEQLINA